MCNFSEGIEEKGIEKGIQQGVQNATLASINKMMKSLRLNREQVYDVLELDESERHQYNQLLN